MKHVNYFCKSVTSFAKEEATSNRNTLPDINTRGIGRIQDSYMQTRDEVITVENLPTPLMFISGQANIGKKLVFYHFYK